MSSNIQEVRRKDRIAEAVASIRVGRPQLYGVTANNPGLLDDIRQRADESNYLKPKGQKEGTILSVLSEEGLAEEWGSSRYQIQDPDALQYFGTAVENYSSRGWEKHELIGTLKAVSEHILDEDENLTAGRFDEIDRGTPCSKTVVNNFGKWNFALIRAGLEPKMTKMAEEDIRDRFRKAFYEKDGVPKCKEFYGDPRMPNQDQVIGENSEIDSFSELAKSEFPVRYANCQKERQ